MAMNRKTEGGERMAALTVACALVTLTGFVAVLHVMQTQGGQSIEKQAISQHPVVTSQVLGMATPMPRETRAETPLPLPTPPHVLPIALASAHSLTREEEDWLTRLNTNLEASFGSVTSLNSMRFQSKRSDSEAMSLMRDEIAHMNTRFQSVTTPFLVQPYPRTCQHLHDVYQEAVMTFSQWMLQLMDIIQRMLTSPDGLSDTSFAAYDAKLNECLAKIDALSGQMTVEFDRFAEAHR